MGRRRLVNYRHKEYGDPLPERYVPRPKKPRKERKPINELRRVMSFTTTVDVIERIDTWARENEVGSFARAVEMLVEKGLWVEGDGK